MALHGRIMVNGDEIGYWEARCALERGADGVSTYQTTVRLNGTTTHGTVQHQWQDGAALLASKVLATAGTQTPPAPASGPPRH